MCGAGLGTQRGFVFYFLPPSLPPFFASPNTTFFFLQKFLDFHVNDTYSLKKFNSAKFKAQSKKSKNKTKTLLLRKVTEDSLVSIFPDLPPYVSKLIQE